MTTGSCDGRLLAWEEGWNRRWEHGHPADGFNRRIRRMMEETNS